MKKSNITLSTDGIGTYDGTCHFKGTVSFSKIKPQPLCIVFNSPVTGEKIGELREKDGMFTFEGKADEAAKVFFNDLSKIIINSKK